MMEFFATCAWGLESVLGDELRSLGIHKVRPLSGGVSFQGEVRDAYTVLLWSRVASRVLCVLARVSSSNSDKLYAGAKSIPWEQHFKSSSTVAVSARGTSETLRDTRFTALRVKDAVCDCFRELTGERPNVDTDDPDILIQVTLRGHKATISLDLSGGSLEDRGYTDIGRRFAAEMRETLAAAMLLESGWTPSAHEGVLVDPFCASATLAIEGALIAGDVAPGIMREHWGFAAWSYHDEKLWDSLLDDADLRAQNAERSVRVFACEKRAEMLDCAQKRAKRAAVANLICFESDYNALKKRVAAAACPVTLASSFMSIPDIAPASLPALYAAMSKDIRQLSSVQTLACLTDDPHIDASLDFKQETRIETKNGNKDCFINIFKCSYVQKNQNIVTVHGQSIAVNDKNAQQFADRLNKVAKQRRKWAKRSNIYAYRVYDADLPDFNIAVDVYSGAGKDEGTMYIHVAEYAPPRQIDPAKAACRMADALNIISAIFELPMSHVFVKRRTRAKGGSQYSKKETPAYNAQDAPSLGTLVTRENGLLFEVNLADYLDTGLFLDHRDTRALLAKLVHGKSFLNLFAYTGSVSVYAAAAGAKFTTTVDLSNTYLQWAQRNMELNGLMNEHQEFERADCLQWIQKTRHSKLRWDFIFIDPPTFSNSAKMGKRSWDVQRDHAELLIGASRLLTRGGTMMFSCNLRNFKPDVQKLAKAGVVLVDVTEKTIPPDFERNPLVHHCYLLRRG